MVRRVAVAAAACILATSAFGFAPRALMGSVAQVPDGTSPDGGSWRWWDHVGAGLASRYGPNWRRSDEDRVGVLQPGWYLESWFDYDRPSGNPHSVAVMVEQEIADPLGPRFLAGYVAMSDRFDGGERPFVLPPSTLRRIPDPAVSRSGEDVTIFWSAMGEDVPGVLIGYRIYHSLTGVADWKLLVQTDLTEVTLRIPTGCAGWFALRPVAIGGIESLTMSIAVAAPDAPPSDRDGDTFADPCDNCPEIPNPEQADWNGDGRGNWCDPPPGDVFLRVLRGYAPDYVDLVMESSSASVVGHEAIGRLPWPAGAPFVYNHRCLGRNLSWALRETVRDISVEALSNHYFLVAVQRGATWDWGTDSFGSPIPDANPPCP